jgi:protein involved in polysaccharide export with SLBB domain
MLTRVFFLLLLGGLTAFGFGQTYELEPYDALSIQCPAYPSLQAEVTIDGLGVASLPTSSRLILAGLTLPQAEAKLRKFFESKLGVPLGIFRVQQIANPNAPIRIAGAVKHAGLRKPVKGLMLSEVLAIAEPTDTADLEVVQIRMLGKTILVKVGPVETKSDWDVEVRGGDKIFVPTLKGGAQVYVFGLVARPGSVPFARGMTVKDAINQAGGLLAGANLKKVMIDRDGKPMGTVDLTTSDPILEAGDSVRISKAPATKHVVVTGAVAKPGIVTYFEGMTLLKAIEAAGGMDARLTRGRIKLVRRVQGKTSTQFFDIGGLITGSVPDVLIFPDDRIELPEIRG